MSYTAFNDIVNSEFQDFNLTFGPPDNLILPNGKKCSGIPGNENQKFLEFKKVLQMKIDPGKVNFQFLSIPGIQQIRTFKNYASKTEYRTAHQEMVDAFVLGDGLMHFGPQMNDPSTTSINKALKSES